MLSGRLQMSMLLSLRVGETKVRVVPSGLIMIVRMAPLSTNISAPLLCPIARQPSCETSCDFALWFLCLTVIPTCLLEVKGIVCGKDLELSIMKLTDKTYQG